MKTINMAVLIGFLGIVAPAGAEVFWCEMPSHGAAINQKKLADLKEKQRMRRVDMNYTGRHHKRTLDELKKFPSNDQRFSHDAKSLAQARAAYLEEKNKQIKAREWRDFGRIDLNAEKPRLAKLAEWNELEGSLYSGWDPVWSYRDLSKKNEQLEKENAALKAQQAEALKKGQQKSGWFSWIR